MVAASDLTFYRYSPENMDEAVLRKLFVGREAQLESLFSEIETSANNKTPRFYLIIGPRGIGKSHFLSLLYYDIKSKLDSQLIPVKFAEEEYSIYRASDLFLRILEETKEDVSDILSLEKEDDILYGALEKLKQISKRESKRYIIFAENLHELFKQLEKEEVQKLRSIFQKHDIFSVVATAPMIFPEVSEHEEPFYNFFSIKHLNELSFNEIKTLIKKIAETEGNKDFLDEFDKYEEKIHGMEHLTGGSPRLVILFYEMITRGELENVEKAFLKIVDEHTPYYQEIFQLLSGQRRKIFDIVISAGKPVTPKEISTKARIPLPTVTTQLRRLEGDGYVRSRPEGRHTKYEVRERLFRLWREMRQPLGRKRITVLLEFLQYWYTPDERNELFTAKFALLEAGEKTALKELCYYAEALPYELKIEALLKLTPKLMELGEWDDAIHELQRLKETVTRTGDNKELSEISLYDALILFSKKMYHEALEIIDKSLRANPKNENGLLIKSGILSKLGKYYEAIEVLNTAIEITPKNEFALLLKGMCLGYVKEHDKTLEALNKVLEINPKNETALLRKGMALMSLHRHEEALNAFETVLEINPINEYALFKKGVALIFLRKKPETALDAINKTLEINPENKLAVACKGVLLAHLNRAEEALTFLNKFKEVDSKDENVHLAKSLVLISLKRYEEALEVIDKALELNPKSKSAFKVKIIALLSLNRSGEFLKTVKKLLERFENLKEPELIENYVKGCLDFALVEIKVENLGNAVQLMQMAYDVGLKLKDGKLIELTLNFLKEAAESGLPVIKTAVDEILKIKGEEYSEHIKPITKAIEIVETEDMKKYYDLQVEEREIVADIVKKITKSDDLIPEEIKRKERS